MEVPQSSQRQSLSHTSFPPQHHVQRQQRHRRQVHFQYSQEDNEEYSVQIDIDERQTIERVQSVSSWNKQRPNSDHVPSLPIASSITSSSEDHLEVDCHEHPTELFALMNRQLWDRALSVLTHKKIEARIWLSSFYPDSDEYKWRNLPLHLACMHGPEPVPLRFLEALIDAHPDAARCRNAEGNLPIHLACECMGLGPQCGLEVEGCLITLIRAYPGCLHVRDGRGRRPIDILEEKGVKSDRKASRNMKLGRGVSIVTFMKARMKKEEMLEAQYSEEREEELSSRRHEREENDNDTGQRDIIKSAMRRSQHAGPKAKDDRDGYAAQRLAEMHLEEAEFMERDVRSRGPANQIVHNNKKPNHGRSPKKTLSYQSDRGNGDARDDDVAHEMILPRAPPNRKSDIRSPVKQSQSSHHAERVNHNSPTEMNATTTRQQQQTPRRSNRRDDYPSHRLTETRSEESDFDDQHLIVREISKDLTENSEDKLSLTRSTKKLFISAHPNDVRDDIVVAGIQPPSPSTVASIKRYPSSYTSPKSTTNYHTNHDNFAPTRSLPPWSSPLGTARITDPSDPFHHLQNEFSSLRESHQSMTEQLNIKSQIEIELNEKLAKLEEDYAKLKEDHDSLMAQNAKVTTELEERNRSLELCKHEMKVMRTKDKALSAELSLRLESEEKYNAHVQSLGKEIEKERKQREIAEEKLRQREAEFAAMEEKHKLALDTNCESDKHAMAIKSECESLRKEKEELISELNAKEKKLRDSELKESTLMDQLVEKVSVIATARQLQAEAEKKVLNEQEKVSELELKLQEAKDSQSFAEGSRLIEQNAALREVAMKAIQTIGELEERIASNRKAINHNQPTNFQRGKSGSIKESFEKKLMQADGTEPICTDATLKNAHKLDPKQSLAQLSPIIEDAKKLQRTTTDRMQELLRSSDAIAVLIGQISRISHDEFTFESTLQLLEELITTNIRVVDTLDIALETEEKCKSRLANFLNVTVAEDDFSKQEIQVNRNIEILMAAASSARTHSTNMLSFTRKHIEKIESLSDKISQLPAMNKTKDVEKRLFIANEITAVFQKALSNLVKDSKQLKSLDSVLSCANKELAEVEDLLISKRIKQI